MTNQLKGTLLVNKGAGLQTPGAGSQLSPKIIFDNDGSALLLVPQRHIIEEVSFVSPRD